MKDGWVVAIEQLRRSTRLIAICGLHRARRDALLRDPARADRRGVSACRGVLSAARPGRGRGAAGAAAARAGTLGPVHHDGELPGFRNKNIETLLEAYRQLPASLRRSLPLVVRRRAGADGRRPARDVPASRHPAGCDRDGRDQRRGDRRVVQRRDAARLSVTLRRLRHADRGSDAVRHAGVDDDLGVDAGSGGRRRLARRHGGRVGVHARDRGDRRRRCAPRRDADRRFWAGEAVHERCARACDAGGVSADRCSRCRNRK